MKEIRMVDLHAQYLHIKGEVDDAIQRVIDSTAFIKGKDVAHFQDELTAYMGAKHTIACGNGTDALQIAMMALELNPGDEVITTPFTFISTIEVIKLLGLKPLLVDVEEDTFNINPSLLEGVITERTRAIVPVHLFGQCAHMDAILNIARKHNLFVIEDNAQAIGADYRFPDGAVKKAGTLGNIGTTSFFPSKNLGCYGDGGMCFTNDDNLQHILRSLLVHGKGTHKYDNARIGINGRLDTIQAAILLAKFDIFPEEVGLRQQTAENYTKLLSSCNTVRTPRVPDGYESVWAQYSVLTESEDKRSIIQEKLKEKGIPTAIYYPKPLHLQPAFDFLGYSEGDFPVSELFSKTIFSLPMHPYLAYEDQKKIAETICDIE